MTEVFNKYRNGKIYKVFNTIDDSIYIGSTVQSLSHRMIKHKDDVKSNKEYQTTICKLMKQLGVEHFYIELVESYPCDSKEELNAREGFWIKQLATVNKQITGRSRKEHYQDNKIQIQEKSKEYRKQYKIDNKETILARNKEYYQRTKEHKQEYQKSEKVKEWKSTKVECPCGGSYTNCHKAAHLKCAKHKAYEESLERPT